ncbi:MAG: phage terminase large subunit family protein, partial [Akkermansia sp.]
DELFLNELWSDCWRPPDRVPVWQWAEQHIEAIPYSPMPGRFHIDNSPQIRDVMQEIVNPRTRLVSIIASVQSGKTTAPEITLNYIIANLPGPTLWLGASARATRPREPDTLVWRSAAQQRRAGAASRVAKYRQETGI